MEQKAESGSFMERYMTPIAVLLGAIIIAAALAFGNGGNPQAQQGSQPEAVPVDIKDVKIAGNPAVGSLSAPVTIAVWFDFHCSFCRSFKADVLAKVEEQYVQSGQVRIVYKDFQFLTPASEEAAVYSRAVWEAYPDKWNEWFTSVVASTATGQLTTASLDAISSSVGIDTSRIASLARANRAAYLDAINADKAEGQAFGINGTPGSIIGTQLIAGAQPFAAVQAAIEEALK